MIWWQAAAVVLWAYCGLLTVLLAYSPEALKVAWATRRKRLCLAAAVLTLAGPATITTVVTLYATGAFLRAAGRVVFRTINRRPAERNENVAERHG